MREPTNLSDAILIDAVKAEFGITISALNFLPLGADSASAVYRAHAIDGSIYFLKIRTIQGFKPASLLIPTYLHEQGVPHLLTPLPTIGQTRWVSFNEFVLSLFPFMESRVGADSGLTERQWAELGATVKQIHASHLPSDLIPLVPRETFNPSRREVIDQLQEVIESNAISDSVQDELAGFWKLRREDIHSVVERADELASLLREVSSSLVLCHADLHTWNIMLDSSEHIWIADWDETTFALKERDLMFVMGGIGRDLVSPKETECFLQGYGDAYINSTALTYYRFAWAVQDMGAYGEQVFFSPGLGEESRRDALEGFISIFKPGNIADIAFGFDRFTV